mgnify:CR=1 FL=1
MTYYDKYLKYKAKYIAMKQQIGGAKELLKILSVSRAKDYNDWIHIGWTLHNIDKSLLKDFIDFSKNHRY